MIAGLSGGSAPVNAAGEGQEWRGGVLLSVFKSFPLNHPFSRPSLGSFSVKLSLSSAPVPPHGSV